MIALNVLVAQNDKEKIKQTYISKHIFSRVNTVILMMIIDVQQRCTFEGGQKELKVLFKY